MMRKLILGALAATPASLFIASSALAVPPTGFNFDPNTVGGFTATGGIVTSDCAAGYTCTPLEGSGGLGFLQERVTLDTDPEGVQFIHTIVVEDTADTSGPLGFYNNAFIDSSDNTSGSADDVGVKSFIDLADVVGTGQSVALIGRGALQGTNEASRVTLLQNQNTGGANAIDINYEYYDDDGAGHYLRIDQDSGSGSSTRGGNITIRTSGGGFTCIAPSTPAGHGNPGCGTGSITLNSGEVVTYAAGDELHTVLFRTQNFGVAAAADSIVEFQKVVVGGETPGFPAPDVGGDVGGTDYDSLNDEAFGVFNSVGGTAGDPWPAWDGNLGSAPTYDPANGLMTFVP